jgi:hypothetical protein
MVGGIVEPVFPVEGDTYEIDGELLGRRQVSGGQGRDGGIEYCPSVRAIRCRLVWVAGSRDDMGRVRNLYGGSYASPVVGKGTYDNRDELIDELLSGQDPRQCSARTVCWTR